MSKTEYFVVGIMHIDLAWKRGRAEMAEMLEIAVIRILDLLESDPEFHYHLEQVAHFRELQKRRPDLIARLQPHLQSGRLEFVGGMASTLEANLPNGECLVRNLQIGLDWLQKTWAGAAPVTTGWFVDTFGIPSQVPQILQGFGIPQFMASRFGGNHTHDLFLDRGLDGSQVLVAGWGTYAAYIAPVNVSEVFCHNWDDIERCFAGADVLTGPGPFLVIPYTENEMLISAYPQTLIQQRNRERPEQNWRSATPDLYFKAIQEKERLLPIVEGDLNPEFTGCFSLRHPIRLANRRVETRLLEAEKWSTFAGLDRRLVLEEAWWELAYVQFHDVFTGSHPTAVFRDVMRVLSEIEATAETVLASAFAEMVPEIREETPASEAVATAILFNGLPWERNDIVSIPLPADWQGVSRIVGADGKALPFTVSSGKVQMETCVPATGHQTVSLERGDKAKTRGKLDTFATLENEWIRAEFDAITGIKQLVWKPTGRILLEDAGDWLLAQRDDGNFQIENPAGGEVAASSGTFHLESLPPSPLGQSICLSGTFPVLNWAGTDSSLRWSAEFLLPAHRAEICIALHLDWKGDRTRIRLSLPTRIDSTIGHFEVPFGVVPRKSYSPRSNAKGEWPVHRFVAIEDKTEGIALINTGVGGVEVSGGTLYTTLLRSPKSEYVGMVADSTSSQEGGHNYSFAVKPYSGTWSEGGVVQTAQEINSPLIAIVRSGHISVPEDKSFFRLEPGNVVLSSVKTAMDGSGDRVIRLYETAGYATDVTLTFPENKDKVWLCDLRERFQTVVENDGGSVRLSLAPFQIQTVRFQKSPSSAEEKGGGD